MGSVPRVAVCVLTTLVLGGCQSFENIRKVGPGVSSRDSQTVTVMSYNIRVGYGGRDPGVDPYILSRSGEDLPPIIAAIRSIDPDIVGLQEVAGSGQARRLAEALNMNYAYVYHATGSARRQWWGVAVLSKFPILKAQGTEISSGPGNTKSIRGGRVVVGIGFT